MRSHWLAWVGKWPSVSEKVGETLPQSLQETKVRPGLNSVSGVCTEWGIKKFFDHQINGQRTGAEVITRWNLLIWGSVGLLSGIFFTSLYLKQDWFTSLKGYGRLLIQLGGGAFAYHPFLGFALSSIDTDMQTNTGWPACMPGSGGQPTISSKEPILFLLWSFFLYAAGFCFVAQPDLEPWSACLSL